MSGGSGEVSGGSGEVSGGEWRGEWGGVER